MRPTRSSSRRHLSTLLFAVHAPANVCLRHVTAITHRLMQPRYAANLACLVTYSVTLVSLLSLICQTLLTESTIAVHYPLCDST